MKNQHWKFVLKWIFIILFCMLLFTFLHECGHGFGSLTEGIHISTSFNRTGDIGKKPIDPDFYSNQYVDGTTDSGSFLGPFVNWVFAVISTVLLINVKKRSSRESFLLGACAVSNAWIRFFPMLWFFLSAPFNHVHMEDEVQWGVRSITSVQFPMPNNAFVNLAKIYPKLFLLNPYIYFWPLVSITISAFCLVAAYREINKQFKTYLNSKTSKILFILAPILVTPLWGIIINILDNAVRINW